MVPADPSASSVYSANWTQHENLPTYGDFPAGKRDAFHFAVTKAEEIYPYVFSPGGDYPKQLGLIVLNDVPHAQSFCYCRPFEKGMFNWKCGMPDFCPHCGFLRVRNDLDRLAEAMLEHEGEFSGLTLSFSRPILLGADLDLALLLWDMLEALVRQAHEQGLFEGVLFSKEMNVTQLGPALGIVHGHGLLHCRHPRRVIKWLKRTLLASDAWRELIKRGLVPAGFAPNLQLDPLDTAPEVRNWLIYSTKPVSVVAAYEAAYARVRPELRWPLNQHAGELLSAWDLMMTRDVRQTDVDLYRAAGRIIRLGSLYWRGEKSLTTPKKFWKDPGHVDLVNEIRIESKQRRADPPEFSSEDEYLAAFPDDNCAT